VGELEDPAVGAVEAGAQDRAGQGDADRGADRGGDVDALVQATALFPGHLAQAEGGVDGEAAERRGEGEPGLVDVRTGRREGGRDSGNHAGGLFGAGGQAGLGGGHGDSAHQDGGETRAQQGRKTALAGQQLTKQRSASFPSVELYERRDEG